MRGERGEFTVAARALDFALRERLEAAQRGDEPVAKQRIAEHGEERRREGDGDGAARAPLGPRLQHAKQGQVAFDQRLHQPALLERVAVLRMADEGEMRVQHEREEPRGRAPFRRHDFGLAGETR